MAYSQIIMAKQSLTTANKLRQDTQMIMQPYANWEAHLTPIPQSLTILGELVFISSKADFSIGENPPKDGFKFIQYPNSFRACLMQVCNVGWNAFNEAHTSMDQIRLHTSNVPQYVRTAVEVILKNDDRLLEVTLPDTLKSIDDIANECLKLSTSTDERFKMLISLVHEILEASTNAKQSHTEKLKNVTQKIEQNQIYKESKIEAEKRTAEELKDIRNKMDAAEQLFEKAVNSRGWKTFGLNLAEGLTGNFNSLASGVINIVTLNWGRKKEATSQVGTDLEPMDYFAVNDVYAQSSLILALIEKIKSMTEESKIDWGAVYDQNQQKANTDFIKEILVEVKKIIESLKDSDAKNTGLGICKKGISICKELASIAPNRQCESPKEQQLIEDIAKLHEEAQTFNTKGKQVTNTTPLSQTPPGLSQAKSKDQKRPAKGAAQSSRIQIAETSKALDTARQMYSTAVERYEKTSQDMADILATLKNCDVTKIDFTTTLEILAQGLTALGKVKEQWEKMVGFFQIVTTLIKVCLNTATKSFTSRAKQASEYSSNDFLKDMVYTQAFQVSNVANLVHMISSTYTEVSEKYIMDRVSSLGRLMTLDHNSEEFNYERKKLQDGCMEAQNGIMSLVLENKTDFKLKTEERMVHLEELQALLPPPTKEEEEKVKRIVYSPSEEVDQFA